ncbi:hypothetical protein [Neptunicella marina]|uniref:Uncharacterized protein n=1 Tax=Neptunicella marina TaxID=2125989 RepID=A0A8J6IV34_9ALTE|nr:hypothetical protein [Neptunicella marina]MBC3766759.1 hypothetical protein [Neptunicella marina]
MKFVKYHFFFLVSPILTVFVVSGCSTQLKIAGEQHHNAAEKWYALSQYTASWMPKYGFTVTAQLSFRTEGNEVLPYLSSITLSRKAGISNIDLLIPEFENKFICIKQCMQLTELQLMQGSYGNTLLSQYLKAYEFALFDFYAEMFLLNDKLALIQTINASKLSNYLNYLSNIHEEFKTLKSLTDWLGEQITPAKFKDFLNDPTLEYKATVNAYFKDQNVNLLASEPDSAWQIDDQQRYLSEDKMEKGEVEKDAMDPTQSWIVGELVHSPDQYWQSANDVPQESINWLSLKEVYFDTKIWEEAKQAGVVVGDTVCSYQDNYFGVVSESNDREISVFVQGQGRTIRDGLIIMLPRGALFTPESTLTFLPIATKMNFAIDDIAICTINLGQ